MNRTTANVLLLIAGAVWGMGFIAQQTAMEDMPAMLFIALRFLLAAAVVAPLALLERRRKQGEQDDGNGKPANVLHYSILGAVFFGAMTCQQLGLLATTVTNAGFLTTIYVVFVPVILLTVFRQRQPSTIWIAAVMTLTGIYLLSDGDLTSINWGDWLVILCALLWAVHVLLVGKYVADCRHPVAMATTQFFVCGLLASVAHGVCVSFGWSEWGMDREVLLAAAPEILYAGVLSGGLAFTLQILAQQYTRPSVAAILMGTESLFAAIFGAIFLANRLSVMGYAGCALIFAAVVIVELIPSKADAIESS